MKFLILLGLVGLSLAQFTNYNEFTAFATKNHLKSVSDYAITNGFNNFDEQFENFRIEFKKQYNTEEEKEMRKFYFMKSLENIKSHNELYKKGDVLHELGLNHFADMTSDEYKLMQSTIPFNLNITRTQEPVDSFYDDLPINFDWRQKNKVTPIKNQGSCGSCWAFASIATIEAAHAIKHNEFISLSEQQLVDCSSDGKYQNRGCDHGYSFIAYQYIVDNGIESSADYPYIEKDSYCQNLPEKSHFKISGYKQLSSPASDLEIMNAIYNIGPVAVIIDSIGNDFKLYRGGIISTGNHKFTHFVAAVGWGTENGTDYWIIKNSFGTKWGENGFGRMIRGQNIRNFNYWPLYPVL